MKSFKEFKSSLIKEETHKESRAKQLKSIERSKIVIFLQKSGIELGKDYVYNSVTKKYIVSDKETAESIIDEIATFDEFDVMATGPDSLEQSDVELLKKYNLRWQVPYTIELKSLETESIVEAELKGNLGIPGEDGEGESYLDKIKRQKDAQFRGTSPQRLMPELMSIQRYLSDKSAGNEEELEKLAESLMIQLYGSVLPDDIRFDIKLVESGRDVKNFLDEMSERASKRQEESEEEEYEEEESDEENEQPQIEQPEVEIETPEERERQIKLEIDKRKMANLIIQGEALNVKSVIEMPECKDEIKRILGDSDGEEFIRKLIRLTEIGKALDWFIPSEHRSDMMENHPEGFAGASHVDWSGDDEEGGESGEDNQSGEIEPEDMSPVFRIVGVDFVMLIHESVKTVYEYLSTPGISSDPEIAQIVKQQTSSFADEADEFKYGPEVAAELRDFINVNPKVDRYPNTREFVYISLMEMDAEDFLFLMKGILSSTPKARKDIDAMIDDFISSMEQYEKELAEWEMSQKYAEEEYEEGEEESEIDKLIRMANSGEEKEPEAIDPSQLSNSQIKDLIDDALDRRDYKEVERLSKYLNESKYIRILESYIDSKNNK